jgi:hypothetical protein
MDLIQTLRNYEGITGIRNRLLRGQGRSFQVIEAPRGHPFGGGAGHHNSGIGASRNFGIVPYLLEILLCRKPQNISLNALFWATACNASAPPPLWQPLGAITPEKVIRHNRKTQGRFGGDRHCPLQ